MKRIVLATVIVALLACLEAPADLRAASRIERPGGAGGLRADCNTNGIDDADDMANCDGSAWCGDCNENGILDECDIADGTSDDCNEDEIPDECTACPPVELVFIVDTSGSMDDEILALCTDIDATIASLQNAGISVIHEILAIGIESRSRAEPSNAPEGDPPQAGRERDLDCDDGTVEQLYGTTAPGLPEILGESDGEGSPCELEDWGPATAIVAANKQWASNTMRIIVPIADEGPRCGSPVNDPGNDRDAIDHAIPFVAANQVMVSPIIGTEYYEGDFERIWPLAEAVAAGGAPGGAALQSTDPANDLAAIIIQLVNSACVASSDCNENGVLDACDIDAGTSLDCQTNGVPDECEGDCNSNGIADECDIDQGTSADCNDNSIPDECETDCNGNGTADECDIDDGTSNDCNLNRIPDDCEIPPIGPPESDCDSNGIPDDCDLAEGSDFDCNGNGVLDGCDLSAGTSVDDDGTGVPDECEATVLYVDAAAVGLNYGIMWADAYADLQDALAVAATGTSAVEEIWVAAADLGYRPDRGSGDRTASFFLASGVAVYGGFLGNAHPLGGESQLSQRDPTANMTVLSGDIGITGDTSDNSYHVVRALDVDHTAVLDGFTVAEGAAGSQYWPHESGGAMLIQESSPTITGCAFHSNTARWGGAMYAYIDASPTVTLCTFTSNDASWGGAMYNDFGAGTSVTSCDFLGNTASSGGGAIFNNNNSMPAFFDCDFNSNDAQWGGAMYNDFGAGTSVTSCDFSGNTASSGGGAIFNNNNSMPAFSDCDFDSNAAQWGGAMYNDLGASTSVTSCGFSGNTAASSGGAVYNNDNSMPTFSDCDFSSNGAQWGGAMYNNLGAGTGVTSCGFADNTASNEGGAISNYSSTATFADCEFIGNTADNAGGAVRNVDGGSPTFTGCSMRSNQAGGQGGGVYNWNCSPQLTGCTFEQNSAYDGGAMASLNTSASNAQDCQFVLNQASHDGGAIRADFAAIDVANCLFAGNMAEGAGGGIWVQNQSTGVANQCVFDGNSAGHGGGGVGNHQASLDLQYCAFRENTSHYGAGVWTSDAATVSIENTAFVANAATGNGGACDTYQGATTINGCRFEGNTAVDSGGAMNVVSSDCAVHASVFAGNEATWGGGLDYDDRASGVSPAEVADCLFLGNQASWGGAGRAVQGSAYFRSCTFADNHATAGGGGLLISESGTVSVSDCIVWSSPPEPISSYGSTTVVYSDIQGGWTGPGENNIDLLPLFTAGPEGCYYLSHTAAGQPWQSPCVDAGSDTAANLGLYVLTTRRDEVGDAGTVDMGYHYPVTVQSFTHGDYDRDGDIDLDDWTQLGVCLTGPCGVAPCPAPLYSDACCSIADFDDDGDVDLYDFAEFQRAFGQ